MEIAGNTASRTLGKTESQAGPGDIPLLDQRGSNIADGSCIDAVEEDNQEAEGEYDPLIG